jgi:small subunit ribosomal protein S20
VAHSLSAKKRIRQNVKRRLLNRSRRSALRGKLRKCGDVLQRGSASDAEETVSVAIKALDREASRGMLHRNAAARHKSRLVRRLNALRAKASE